MTAAPDRAAVRVETLALRLEALISEAGPLCVREIGRRVGARWSDVGAALQLLAGRGLATSQDGPGRARLWSLAARPASPQSRHLTVARVLPEASGRRPPGDEPLRFEPIWVDDALFVDERFRSRSGFQRWALLKIAQIQPSFRRRPLLDAVGEKLIEEFTRRDEPPADQCRPAPYTLAELSALLDLPITVGREIEEIFGSADGEAT